MDLYEPLDHDSAKLERAARSNDLETVKRLIAGKAVSAEEKKVARLAAENGNLDILLYLGARNSTRPEWTRRDFESLAVHTSIEFGKFPVVKHFIEKEGVDVDITNEFGETPIFTALLANRRDIFKYLVEERKANLTATDSRGNNVLHIAAKAEDLATVRYIMDEKKLFDVNVRNTLGDTPLHHAVRSIGNKQYDKNTFNWREDIELINYLVIEKKADVNAVGSHGKTPLHVAALLSHLKICNMLIEHGADSQLRDGGGHNYWEITGFRKRHIRSVPVHTEDQSAPIPWNLPGRGIHDDTSSVGEVASSTLTRNQALPAMMNFAPLVVIAQLMFKNVRRSHAALGRAESSFIGSPSDMVRGKVDPVALDAVQNVPNFVIN